jgi:hypothetical protein
MSVPVVLVGVFERPRNAVDVMRALRISGVPARELGLAQRTGEILQTVGLLSDADVPEHDFAGALIGLGVPVQQARQCWQALEEGCAIVAARPENRQVVEATSAFETYGVSSLCVCSFGSPVACL